MKKLPIGIQTFKKIIEGEYIYVDKTKYYYELLKGTYYFLSRPRRFGKSLTISALEQIFCGNKELFKNLWIYDKIEWEQYPIIRIDYSGLGHKVVGLEEALDTMLDNLAKKNGITCTANSYPLKLDELIKKLASTKPVVILIDEYDKPIIDHIENIEQANKNREVLKNLYSIIKGNDANIKFFFITGVSKFSQVSIFSDLNNLTDITIDERFSMMLGYTQTELEFYFEEGIKKLETKYKDVFPNILETIKDWYNGYSWDGLNFVYNPFSILNLFAKNDFDNYWFKTGTPTFLIKLIEQGKFNSFDLENKIVSRSVIDKYDINNLEISSLLLQTGYLTIKNISLRYNTFTLKYPNREVAESFSYYLLSSFNKQTNENNSSFLFELTQNILNNGIEKFIETFKIIFANLTYPNIDNKEKYYHSIFFLTLKLLGYNIQSEVLTIDGRIDVLMQTDTHIYVIEFKIGDAKVGLQQIKDKNYHHKYLNDNKTIVLLGIGFDTTTKNIGSFEYETVVK